MFLLSFLFECGYLLVGLLGVVSGMRKELLLRPRAVFARVRSDGGVASAASGVGLGSGVQDWKQYPGCVVHTPHRGMTCTLCGIRVEISSTGGQKVLRYRIP
jgi:hypothetical protein